MTIHHTHVKKAQKLGFVIDEKEDHITMFLPRRAIVIHGIDAKDALNNAELFLKIEQTNDGVKPYDFTRVSDQYMYRMVDRHGLLVNDDYSELSELVDIVRDYEDGTGIHMDDSPEDNFPTEKIETEDLPVTNEPAKPTQIGRSDTVFYTKNHKKIGVPLDGAIAYSEGVVTADCPFDPESDDEEEQARADAWYEAWDAAADAKEEEKPEGGSVVSDRYRTIYAEKGHPTHCGDWLAVTLNNILVNKAGTNIELFETICNMNGVSLDKYDRTKRGWEGRLRMTGRNLLAKAVYIAGGKLIVPSGEETETFQAPADWMAMQKFKMPKAQQ